MSPDKKLLEKQVEGMRRPKAHSLLARFRPDPGIVVAWLMAALAAWPFLSRPSLPVFTDAEMHVYRTFEILSAWRAGVPYLRWAPDFFHAFGYPVFNFYAPLTYYLGAAYGWFLGGPVAGVKFVFVAVYFAGATGMYLFVRDQWGGLSGVVSAAAFLFAPYVVYTDTHGRGDSPEAFAIALAPLTFWAFLRLRRTGSKTDVALAAVALAALSLSHNLMALVFFGLLLAWLGWQVLWAGTERRRLVVTSGLAVLLGLGLSSFMWLPAVLERGAIQIENLTLGEHFNYWNQFVKPEELFGPSQTADLMEQFYFRFRLGVAQWVLGGFGILTILFNDRRREQTLFFLLVSVGLVFMMLPMSLPAWRVVPGLGFLQFPWRLLGPAAMTLGVLAGISVEWGSRPLGRSGASVVGALECAALVAAVSPILNPLPWSDLGPVSETRILQAELSRNVGTTATNEFLPVETVSVPWSQPSLIESYETGVVDKINHATLPEGTQASVLEHGPLYDRFLVTGDSPLTLRVFTFYFPGWTAYVDGAEVPITPSEPEGWITLEVPAGRHEVLLRFEDTPPRQLGWALSGLAAACMLGLLLSGRRRLGIPSAPEPLPMRAGLALGLLVLAGLGARAWADQSSWWRVRRESTVVPGAGHAQVVRFEGNIALLAYDLPRTAARPGERLPLTLYWQALEVVPANLRVFVHLVGPDGQLWGQSDKLHPAGLPTGRWPLDRYLTDVHEAWLRPDAPPGTYTLKVGLWDELTGQRMRVVDESGSATDADGALLDSPFIVQP